MSHEVNEAPFYLVTQPLNLVADADALIASRPGAPVRASLPRKTRDVTYDKDSKMRVLVLRGLMIAFAAPPVNCRAPQRP